jgi:enoyl-[acyl-carrier-protein] reductase (NADH)
MRIFALKGAHRMALKRQCDCSRHLLELNLVGINWQKKRGLEDEEEMMKGMVDRIVPMNKTSLAPRDIGNAAAFLCSDAGRLITGTTVTPVEDGGIHLLSR